MKDQFYWISFSLWLYIRNISILIFYISFSLWLYISNISILIFYINLISNISVLIFYINLIMYKYKFFFMQTQCKYHSYLKIFIIGYNLVKD